MTQKEIVALYQQTKNSKKVASAAGISQGTVRKILCNNGIYFSHRAQEIHRLLAGQYTPEEIMQKLNISPKVFWYYMPYEKTPYAVGPKSANAERIRKCRERKARNPE